MGREHWVETTLGEIATHPQYGWTTKAGQSGTFKYFRTTDINSPIAWEVVPFCVELPKNLEEYAIKKNDILVSRAGSVGLSIRFEEDHLGTLFASYLIRFRAIPPIDSKFIAYFLLTRQYWDFIRKSQSGIAVPNVNASKLSDLPIPLPPLNEQRRIVAKLDALLPKVKSVQARLAKIPGILKKFRQSVLAAACAGRLTEEFRQSDGYNDEDIPVSWNRFFLPEVLESKPKNGYSGKPVKYATNTKVLSLSATTSGVFKDQYFKYLDEAIPEDSPFWIKENDILIQRGNTLEYVGVPAIYKGENNKFIYPDLMIRLIANRKLLTPDYLYHYLSWEKIRNYMRDNASGTAGSMPKINQRVLETLVIFLPPLAEQHEIVRRVERLFALADSLEAKYRKALDRVNKIEQALLAKAFRGELAPSDSQDESAEVLLQRILAEKAKVETGKKMKKKK